MQHDFLELDGALLVDKPAGPTSHDIVDLVRDHLRIKKVGHCGTLDPAATGLLILVLGRATRLSEKLMSDNKTYEGVIEFGISTDSHDADGKPTERHPVPPLDLAALNEHSAQFVGDLMQEPPMISAVKQGGVPLYKLARKGKVVERKSRLIHIFEFQFTRYDEPMAFFRVSCTKGTYVRSLAHDMGKKIGCGAHLNRLRRTRSGKFDVANAVEMESIPHLSMDEIRSRVLPFGQLVAMIQQP
ncbi:MAG: tRNA pseudouridine(55) synthase TruB [Pedosphaera sp.]|nr:tRNA pseudouridine(55) synthase TruB [Pedosphaera sp.]